MKAELLLTFACAGAALAGDFADRVVEYSPAPGQLVTDPDYNAPARALGAPEGGGTINGAATGVVTLGGFGGTLVLAFDETVEDDPRNYLGLDAIIFGNAFWQCFDGCIASIPNRRWGEAGVIEIALDTNENGLADDVWYVIPGSSLSDPPASALRDGAYELPDEFAPPPPFFLINDLSAGEAHAGYADLSPTLLLGDYTGALGAPGENTIDDEEDDPLVDPGAFYTAPDDPAIVGIDPASCGGDAFDIAWAVDPVTGAPANLPGFDFIRIRTAVDASLGPLGEISTEIDAVSDVRAVGDFNGDGAVDSFDLAALLAAWGASGRHDLNRSGVVGPGDLAALLANWG